MCLVLQTRGIVYPQIPNPEHKSPPNFPEPVEPTGFDNSASRDEDRKYIILGEDMGNRNGDIASLLGSVRMLMS
jgi:hypothetical protein